MTTKICFVIAPIGELESETRKRSDQVLRHVIRPAVEPLGYEAIRADEIAEPGLITSQVIQHVVDDLLVVADLTERNPNVFYELALRHALRKPLIQLIAHGEHIPFDVAGMRTVSVNHRDLDSVEEAKQEIAKQAQALERAGANVESPISVALDLQSLRQSDNPEQRSLADLLAAVADLRTSVAAIEKRLGDPESLVPRAYLRHAVRGGTTPETVELLRAFIAHSRPESSTATSELDLWKAAEIIERYKVDLDRPTVQRRKDTAAGSGGVG